MRGSLIGEVFDKGGRIIPDDLFAKAELERAGKPLTAFRAALERQDSETFFSIAFDFLGFGKWRS